MAFYIHLFINYSTIFKIGNQFRNQEILSYGSSPFYLFLQICVYHHHAYKGVLEAWEDPNEPTHASQDQGCEGIFQN
jgi:hypothetical protein